MHPKISLIARVALLAAAVATLALFAIETQAAVREFYKIKSTQIKSLPAALSLLRRFTPNHVKLEQRCERYAILLQALRSSNVDQFYIAKLGINPQKAKLKLTVDIETLRNLYTDAISELQNGHLDHSLLDLVECLRSKFWAVDATAKSFLNNEQLKRLVEQYRSVLEQPMELLVDGDLKHPSLDANQLSPPLRRTLEDLYGGDTSKLESHFPPARVAAEPVTVATTTTTTEAPVTQPPPPPPAMQAASAFAGASGGAGATAFANAVVDQGYQQQQPGQQPEEHQFEPELLHKLQNLQPESEYQPEHQHEHEHEPHEYAQDAPLSEAEEDFLNDVKSNLQSVFDGLPVNAELPERCMAYSKVTNADETALKDPKHVENVVAMIGDLVAQKPAHSEADEQETNSWVPEKDVRDSFMVVLDAYEPKDLGVELWIDVLDCVTSWKEVDPEILVYVQNVEQSGIVDELANYGDEASTADEPTVGAGQQIGHTDA